MRKKIHTNKNHSQIKTNRIEKIEISIQSEIIKISDNCQLATTLSRWTINFSFIDSFWQHFRTKLPKNKTILSSNATNTYNGTVLAMTIDKNNLLDLSFWEYRYQTLKSNFISSQIYLTQKSFITKIGALASVLCDLSRCNLKNTSFNLNKRKSTTK